MKARILTALSVCLLAVGMAVGASAQGNGNGNGNEGGNGNGHASPVPEINPSSAAEAVALLTAGLLVIRERRRRP